MGLEIRLGSGWVEVPPGVLASLVPGMDEYAAREVLALVKHREIGGWGPDIGQARADQIEKAIRSALDVPLGIDHTKVTQESVTLCRGARIFSRATWLEWGREGKRLAHSHVSIYASVDGAVVEIVMVDRLPVVADVGDPLVAFNTAVGPVVLRQFECEVVRDLVRGVMEWMDSELS